jgi:indole-3-glycerol phosphate synthase
MPDLTGTFLGEIVAARRRQIEEVRQRVPLESVQAAAEARVERRDFAAALRGSTLRVIAELKRASPSRGLLCQRYRRREIARSYEAAEASALSVLTEERYFLGSLEDLVEVRSAVRLPVLRKDFILEPYQVYESAAAGADALLLIVAALPDKDLRDLLALSGTLRLAALVEVHTAEELDRALAAGAKIIGVNNRDLKTLHVDLEVSLRLRPRVSDGCLAISESGIRGPADMKKLAEARYHAVLIGERFMTAEDPGKELAEFLKLERALAR